MILYCSICGQATTLFEVQARIIEPGTSLCCAAVLSLRQPRPPTPNWWERCMLTAEDAIIRMRIPIPVLIRYREDDLRDSNIMRECTNQSSLYARRPLMGYTTPYWRSIFDVPGLRDWY